MSAARYSPTWSGRRGAGRRWRIRNTARHFTRLAVFFGELFHAYRVAVYPAFRHGVFSGSAVYLFHDTRLGARGVGKRFAPFFTRFLRQFADGSRPTADF
jgi:hypothetical protein